ncbi:hypothetical protein J4Q44_G00384000 [Coregonus suidteri]|uniref:Uncharacterized protein n=1 Tax=Coregonus suidteri TaxID=861788 RepID=A0AAN8QJ35_9TELE
MQKQPCPSYKQFMEYRSSKSKERQSFNYGPKGRYRPKERKHVQINVGLMVPSGTDLKPLRGKTLPLFTDPEKNTIKEWMIPQTLILKLSSQQGAQLNSIVLTLWFLNHKIEVLPNTSWTIKEMHQDNQQFSQDR